MFEDVHRAELEPFLDPLEEHLVEVGEDALILRPSCPDLGPDIWQEHAGWRFERTVGTLLTKREGVQSAEAEESGRELLIPWRSSTVIKRARTPQRRRGNPLLPRADGRVRRARDVARRMVPDVPPTLEVLFSARFDRLGPGEAERSWKVRWSRRSLKFWAEAVAELCRCGGPNADSSNTLKHAREGSPRRA